MFKRLVVGALFAGLFSGAIAAVIQLAFVVPLIHEGELYESGAVIHFGVAGSHEPPADATTAAPQIESDTKADHDHAAHDHSDAPESLLTRGLGTFGFFLLSYTGFALFLVAAFAWAERAGHRITARSGVIWGLCGFLAVQLAPAFGLPPGLPGGTSAPLDLRQIWWIGCVLATVAGIGLLAFGKTAIAIGSAVFLIAAPHLIGAPETPFGGVSPPELAAHFTARVLGAGAVCWILLGTIAGAIWAREA